MLQRLVLAVGIATIALGCTGAWAGIVEGEPRVEIWTDRGTGGVYRVGDDVEVCFRADSDCYVLIYEIDTDGYLRLLFPYYCHSDGFVEGGLTYRLGRGHFGRYYVTGPRGVEYVHVLASFGPFRTLYWHGCDGYEEYAHDVSWHGFNDYWGCALPPRVYGDPYMAMQSIDEFICYDALDAGGTAPAVLNGADEMAVHLFLTGKARFSQIPIFIELALNRHIVVSHPGLEEILHAAQWAKEIVQKHAAKAS